MSVIDAKPDNLAEIGPKIAKNDEGEFVISWSSLASFDSQEQSFHYDVYLSRFSE